MIRRIVPALLLAAAASAASAPAPTTPVKPAPATAQPAAPANDALAVALKGQDGDPFAADRIQEVLIVAPRAQRAALVRRIADSDRDDVGGILSRLIQDDDPASAEIAIDALAKRWPTSMQDVEQIRALLLREGRVGGAACRFAAAVGDDEALPLLAERGARFPSDADAEAALRRLTSLPSGCGPEGWVSLVETRLARQEAAISGAEHMLSGTPAEAMGALTLVAGMRPAGSRGARVLLAALEHPDQTVRRMAISILGTCDAPAAAVWRNRSTTAGDGQSAMAAASAAAPSESATVAGASAPAVSAAAPVVHAAPSPAAGGGGWIWLLGLVVVAGGAGWFIMRRSSAPAADAPAPRQGRVTWGG